MPKRIQFPTGFYQPYQFLRKKNFQKIQRQIAGKEWHQAWSLSGNKVIASHFVTAITDSDVIDMVQVPTVYRYRVDWWFDKIQISKYPAGSFFDWHDDRSNRKSRYSRRLTVLISSLTDPQDSRIQTQQGDYVLAKGEAIYFPAEDPYKIIGPSSGEYLLLTIWGMQNV